MQEHRCDSKTLEGRALDHAVAVALKLPMEFDPMGFKSGSEATFWIWDGAKDMRSIGAMYAPSSDFSDGGPLLERHRISTTAHQTHWRAAMPNGPEVAGPTMLIAAMRALVMGLRGKTVNVPNHYLITKP